MAPMRKSILILAISLSLISPSASAIEDGTSAAGNSYVVPVMVGITNQCSGIMISKNVVATAAHCLLDSTKQISKSIYVGLPGSKIVGLRNTNVTHTFIPDDYSGSGADNRIGESDIAFLVLSEIYPTYGFVEIASENDLASLKQKSAPLRVYGYGYTSNSGDFELEPRYFDGKFDSNYNSGLMNSFGVTSTKGNACGGDSGSPILSITPKEVLLVGILTGGLFNEGGKCSKKSASGTYSSVFSGISRYSNALHLALVQGSENLIKSLEEKDRIFAELETENTDTTRLNVDLQFENEDLKIQLDELRIEVENLRKMKKVLTCVSGSKVKTVIGIKPVCPKGYKERA